MSEIDDVLRIAHAELTLDFVRSAGPGGQNVNKVATSVQLRFDVGASRALPPPAKSRLKRLAGNRITGQDVLIIEARRYRTQDQNRKDAIARLDALLRRSLQKAKPRLPTRATAASREKRLQSKKKRADVKRMRQGRSHSSD